MAEFMLAHRPGRFASLLLLKLGHRSLGSRSQALCLRSVYPLRGPVIAISAKNSSEWLRLSAESSVNPNPIPGL